MENINWLNVLGFIIVLVVAKLMYMRTQRLLNENSGMPRQHLSTHTANVEILTSKNLKLNKARQQIIDEIDIDKLNKEQKKIYENIKDFLPKTGTDTDKNSPRKNKR